MIQNGLAHHRAGRLGEAERCYRQARTAMPRHFDVLHLSGLLAYQESRVADAVDLLGRAHAMERRHHVCEMRYALALLAAKRLPEAEKHLRHAVETKPDFHEGWDNLAYCLKLQNRLPEAVECHRKSVAAQPGHAPGWYNYGLTLSLMGRVVQALECHERALAADPAYALARFGRAQALQQAHRIPEAVEEYGRFLKVQPGHHDARSFRLFALQYLDGISREQLFAEHVAYGAALGPVPVASLSNSPEPDRRLRLAILSPDLRTHSCAYFLEPLLAHLDRARFEIFLYHDHVMEDAVSGRLRAFSAVWRNFVGQPGPLVERTIRGDAPDILVDLSGHTGMTSRLPLFARRLAPVQVTYLGYPDTTGVRAMDYRFTDAVADPAGEADAFATERLVRFAPTAWSYQPPATAPAVAEPPCLKRGYVTFGCFNNPAKVTDRTLAVWGRILAATPGSRLQLKGRGLADDGVRARYCERLALAGIAPERVELTERCASVDEHLGLYGGIDLALDTFPYHGTTTTCEALWMGRPVVTLAGDSHRSRVGASLLRAIGRPTWVAEDAEDYVRIATELAADSEKLRAEAFALRGILRASPLLDHAGQAGRFAAALRRCWGEWCERAERPIAAVSGR